MESYADFPIKEYFLRPKTRRLRLNPNNYEDIGYRFHAKLVLKKNKDMTNKLAEKENNDTLNFEEPTEEEVLKSLEEESNYKVVITQKILRKHKKDHPLNEAAYRLLDALEQCQPSSPESNNSGPSSPEPELSVHNESSNSPVPEKNEPTASKNLEQETEEKEAVTKVPLNNMRIPVLMNPGKCINI